MTGCVSKVKQSDYDIYMKEKLDVISIDMIPKLCKSSLTSKLFEFDKIRSEHTSVTSMIDMVPSMTYQVNKTTYKDNIHNNTTHAFEYYFSILDFGLSYYTHQQYKQSEILYKLQQQENLDKQVMSANKLYITIITYQQILEQLEILIKKYPYKKNVLISQIDNMNISIYTYKLMNEYNQYTFELDRYKAELSDVLNVDIANAHFKNIKLLQDVQLTGDDVIGHYLFEGLFINEVIEKYAVKKEFINLFPNIYVKLGLIDSGPRNITGVSYDVTKLTSILKYNNNTDYLKRYDVKKALMYYGIKLKHQLIDNQLKRQVQSEVLMQTVYDKLVYIADTSIEVSTYNQQFMQALNVYNQYKKLITIKNNIIKLHHIKYMLKFTK